MLSPMRPETVISLLMLPCIDVIYLLNPTGTTRQFTNLMSEELHLVEAHLEDHSLHQEELFMRLEHLCLLQHSATTSSIEPKERSVSITNTKKFKRSIDASTISLS